jgi:hypothetical protein
MGQVKPFAKLAAVCAFIALCGYVACSLVFPTIYIRYRLSLDVERDGKVQTSAGVIEISYPILPDLSVEGGMFHGQMHGNAITIELGDQGLAFVVNLLSLAPKPGAGSSGPLRPTETCFLWQLPLAAFGLPIDGEPSTMESCLDNCSGRNDPSTFPSGGSQCSCILPTSTIRVRSKKSIPAILRRHSVRECGCCAQGSN